MQNNIKKNNISYGQAINNDEPSVRDLLKNLNGDRSMFDISRFYLAKNMDKVIGCIRIKALGNNCLELASLGVSQEYRNKGIGSRLISELLLKEKSRPVFLLTSEDKEVFYKKFGFNIIEPQKLSIEFKKEYDKIVVLPFAKNIKVISMIIE